MICPRCLARPLIRAVPRQPRATSRFLTTASQVQAQPPPATTAPSTSQPVSSPSNPSAPKIPKPTTSQPPHPVSSIPAGQPLKGLGYIKNRPDPVAEEDASYPSWLWTCLSDSKTKKSTGGGEADEGEDQGDLFSKSKKQRRVAAKRLRKMAALHPEGLAPKIPLEQQSIDLPANEEGTLSGAIEADQSREDITKRLRQKRRGSIKTANFLKGMR